MRSIPDKALGAAGGLAAVTVALTLASGCGSAVSDVERAQLPRDVAARLASRSDAVAKSLRRGDSCAADKRAAALLAAVEQAIVANRIPSELQSEIRRRAARLADSIVCVPPVSTRDDGPSSQDERPKEEDGDELQRDDGGHEEGDQDEEEEDD